METGKSKESNGRVNQNKQGNTKMSKKAINTTYISIFTLIMFIITSFFFYMAWQEYKEINKNVASCINKPLTFTEDKLNKENRLYNEEKFICSCSTENGRLHYDEHSKMPILS